MKAVHFGAGSIGRGFIGDLLNDSGYEITFLDVDDGIVNQINETQSYSLYLIDHSLEKRVVDKVHAINSAKHENEAVAALRDADIITTSVLGGNLKNIAPVLQKGLAARLEAHRPRVNILACENVVGNSKILRKKILDLSDNELTEEQLDQTAAFPDTEVDRLVLKSVRDGKMGIDIGDAYELVIQRNGLADPKLQPIRGAFYTDDIQKYFERKLYIINTGHAWAGYIGHIYGYTIIQDVFNDPEIMPGIRGTMQETAALIHAKYGFTMDELKNYIDFAINRFMTPGVRDTIVRVSRDPIRKLQNNERMVGPALQLEERGLDNSLLIRGIAAALLFDIPEDRESVKLKKYIKDNGIDQAITHFTGLGSDHPLHDRVLTGYYHLKDIKLYHQKKKE